MTALSLFSTPVSRRLVPARLTGSQRSPTHSANALHSETLDAVRGAVTTLQRCRANSRSLAHDLVTRSAGGRYGMPLLGRRARTGGLVLAGLLCFAAALSPLGTLTGWPLATLAAAGLAIHVAAMAWAAGRRLRQAGTAGGARAMTGAMGIGIAALGQSALIALLPLSLTPGSGWPGSVEVFLMGAGIMLAVLASVLGHAADPEREALEAACARARLAMVEAERKAGEELERARLAFDSEFAALGAQLAPPAGPSEQQAETSGQEDAEPETDIEAGIAAESRSSTASTGRKPRLAVGLRSLLG